MGTRVEFSPDIIAAVNKESELDRIVADSLIDAHLRGMEQMKKAMMVFVAMVGAMRSAQREYFKTRSKSALQRSKDLERRVDRAVKSLSDEELKLF